MLDRSMLGLEKATYVCLFVCMAKMTWYYRPLLFIMLLQYAVLAAGRDGKGMFVPG